MPLSSLVKTNKVENSFRSGQKQARRESKITHHNQTFRKETDTPFNTAVIQKDGKMQTKTILKQTGD